MKEKLDKLSELMSEIPEHIEADWEGTNHYEVRDNYVGGDPFWLDVEDVFWDGTKERDWSATEEGKRLGKLLDFACLSRQVMPYLMADNLRMTQLLQKQNEEIGKLKHKVFKLED